MNYLLIWKNDNIIKKYDKNNVFNYFKSFYVNVGLFNFIKSKKKNILDWFCFDAFVVKNV